MLLSGLSGLSATNSTVQPPTVTALWRALTVGQPAAIATTSNTNFTSMVGEDTFLRVQGARYGPASNPTWPLGTRQTVPYVASAGSITYSKKDMSAETAYKNCGMHCGWLHFAGVANGNFVILNTGPADSPVIGIGVYTSGNNLGFIKWDSVVNGANYATGCELNQWIHLRYAWEYSGSNHRWRAWYKPLGGVLTELGSVTSWAYDVRDYVNPTLKAERNGAGGRFDLSGLGPWYGSVSGQSSYVLNSLEEAATFQTDMIEPSTATLEWLVDSAAPGGGDGRTVAWTYNELQDEIKRCTVMGHHAGQRKSGEAIVVPTTFEQALDFREDCMADSVTAAGHVVRFTGTFYPDTALSFANFVPGVRLTGSGIISSRRTLAGPFVNTDTNVWLAEGEYLHSVSGFDDVGPTIEIDGYQFDPVVDIADVNEPHKVYVDVDGIHFYSATNPNTDGLTKIYFDVMSLGLASYLSMVEVSTAQIDSSLTIECGLIYRYTAETTCPQYGLMVVNGPKTLSNVGCSIVGGSYHALGWIGQLMAGTLCLNGATFSKFCPGHGAVGTTIAMYDPTVVGTGTIFFLLTPDCTELNSIYEGEQASSAVRNFGSIYTHSAGGATNPHWGMYIDGSWKGGIGTSLCRTGERIVADSASAFYIVGD